MKRLVWRTRGKSPHSDMEAPGQRAEISLIRVLIGGGLAALILLGASCASNPIQVHTQAAPNANVASRTTFRVMNVPSPRNGITLASNDPMLVNSITYQALRDELQRAFTDRGYRYSQSSADLAVAYYATVAPKLDIRTYDYGYTWRGFPRQYTEIDQYDQGTVIVDVVDPATHELLWRGTGMARVSQDPNAYVSELRRAVDAIVKKFPAALVQATAKTGYQ